MTFVNCADINEEFCQSLTGYVVFSVLLRVLCDYYRLMVFENGPCCDCVQDLVFEIVVIIYF